MFWTTTACKRIPIKSSPIAKGTNPTHCRPLFKKAPTRLLAPDGGVAAGALAGDIATPRPRVERPAQSPDWLDFARRQENGGARTKNSEERKSASAGHVNPQTPNYSPQVSQDEVPRTTG